MRYPIKLFSLISLLLIFQSTAAWAAPESAGNPEFYGNLFSKMLALISAITIGAALYTFFSTVFLLMNETKKKIYAEQGLEFVEAPSESISMWERFMKWMTDIVPVEKEADVLLDHNYDGIKELDNNLPPWWLAMFYISIVFGVIYFAYYHIAGKGTLIKEQYEIEMAEAEFRQALFLEKQSNKVNEQTVALLTDPQGLENGSAIFISNCASCHGLEGQGMTGLGPNLTDNYWIHGKGTVKDVFRTVKYGVIEKGMQSWQKDLRPRQMQEVASYIITLKGTNPANAKEPEGNLIEPGKDESVKNDTSGVIGKLD